MQRLQREGWVKCGGGLFRTRKANNLEDAKREREGNAATAGRRAWHFPQDGAQRRSGTTVQAPQAAVRHTLALCFPGERTSNLIGVTAAVFDRGVRVRLVVSAWYCWEEFRAMSWSVS